MKRCPAGLTGPAAALLTLGLVAASTPAAAQSFELLELTERVERLERELQTLRRPPSDAAAAKTPDGAAQAEIRLNAFERLLRGFEQRIETLENQRRRDTERLDKLASDLELRLRTLEQGAPPPAASAEPGERSPSVIGGTTAPDAPPRPLGTLKLGSGAEAASLAPPAPALPDGSPKEQYDYALSLTLKEADYAKAGAAFRAFIDAYPKHDLTGNAYFWLGRTHFVRKDYEGASFAFADGYKKFPKGSKAADNLYNLGMSLRALGKKREACTAFARLLDRFPKANPTLKKRVSRQQKRLKCG
ncbi:MAG: tol-pal system protein YbgF [Defluviicoccus sp.]|nr:tol-pal system protein YbgF [Defluviicoccus sp.]MDE0384764.1 tol-pal system protein YbgF [Defluviicoccus sp.]